MSINYTVLLNRYKEEAKKLQTRSNAAIATTSPEAAFEHLKTLKPKFERLINASDFIAYHLQNQTNFPKKEAEIWVKDADDIHAETIKIRDHFQASLFAQYPSLKNQQPIQIQESEANSNRSEDPQIRLQRFQTKGKDLKKLCRQKLLTLHGIHVPAESAEQSFKHVNVKLNGLIAATRFLIEHHFTEEPILIFESTALIDELEKTQKTFNDWFLTLCPQAASLDDSIYISPLRRSPTDHRWSSHFPHYREIRGDGNCFYYSMVVALLEHHVKDKSIHALLQLLNEPQWNCPGKELIIKLLGKLSNPSTSLEEILKDTRGILCFVRLLRQIAAHEMLRKKEDLAPFLSGNFEEYIRQQVNRMGQPADHCAILTLCEALNFSITIYDSTTGQETRIGNETKTPLATFCLHEEHYFIVYRKDQVLTS
jgi:hypothetical protein